MQDKSRFAEWTRSFLCFVNGKQILRENIEPAQTLLSFLRNDLGLTGTKLGCGEGACGACTVTLSSYDICSQKVVHKAINACLAPLASVHGCSITTVEGIGSSTSSLHPIQERIAIYSGSQCGFCTPGIVMSMYSLLCNKPAPSSNDIEDAFDGNLCRCTGYRPILSAFQTFTTAEMPQLCASGKICTSSRETCANTAPKRSRCQYHETDAQVGIVSSPAWCFLLHLLSGCFWFSDSFDWRKIQQSFSVHRISSRTEISTILRFFSLFFPRQIHRLVSPLHIERCSRNETLVSQRKADLRKHRSGNRNQVQKFTLSNCDLLRGHPRTVVFHRGQVWP
eukprot:Sdes_comp20895_c0_seq2m18032